MISKCLLTASLLMLCTSLSFAQNPNLDFKYAIKVSNMATLEKRVFLTRHSDSFVTISRDNDLQIFNPTIAFQIKNKKQNIHEIELTSLELQREKNNTIYYRDNLGELQKLQTLAGATFINTSIAFRYEYIINFAKKQNSRFMPSLGLALMPYYQRSKMVPELSVYYPETRTYIGVRGFVTPRVSYLISKRLSADVNIPVCVTDTYSEIFRTNNPTLPAAAQKNTHTSMETMPKFFSVRAGLRVTI